MPNVDNPPSPVPDAPSAESIKKLDQIVQNFFSKVAVLVIDSRIKVKHIKGPNGARKTSKWFQIETEEFEDFRDELKQWKIGGSLENTPPALVIEIYLDLSKLKESQSLTIVDDEGKRWDVMDQLNSSSSLSGSDSSPYSRNTEVILERWTVELKTTGNKPTEDFNSILPTIYKKAIIFFRSIFTTTRLLPAWKFASQSAARNTSLALVPRCRVRTSNTTAHGADLLRDPIDGKSEPVTDYVFGDLDIPGARLSTTVTYRNDCSFRIDDSEALLSSRFMGIDENFFKPSLTQRDQSTRHLHEVGSFRDRRPQTNLSNIQQPYGSLSTFHGERPLGTSPMTALRAVRAPGSDTSSPPESPPQPGIEPPNSMPTTSSRLPTSRSGPTMPFQPFKAGSLSGSPIPRHSDTGSPALPSSLTRQNAPPSLTQPRNRTSLRAGMPASLRGPPQSTEQVSSSPRAGSSSRYSSSFTHRRAKTLTGMVSKPPEEDQSNSGRQSLPSSVIQPASGLLAEVGTSSDSLQTEDDNISEFLKVLDSKRTLKSFESTKRGESATNKTVAQLSKFHMMRESHNALGDSMTSSMQMHRSSSSSSRQLTSVPGVSMSASSSLSKPQSPHTPHTPAIPSRLSENPVSSVPPNRARASSRPTSSRPFEYVAPSLSRESTVREAGPTATAIDIPLSPRLNTYQRRSSSVAQESRAVLDDEDGPYAANRSLSLGAEDREPPTMSRLLGRQIEAEAAVAASDAAVATATAGTSPASRSSGPGQGAPLGLQRPAVTQTTSSASSMPRGSVDDNPSEGFMTSVPSSSPYGRLRYAGMGIQHRQTPPQSSRGSFTGANTRLPRDDNESLSEEPLVFDLSEMDPQGRRSLEEGRGGSHGGGSRRGW